MGIHNYAVIYARAKKRLEKASISDKNKKLIFTFCNDLVLEDDTLLIKKMTANTFAAITKPLKQAAQKAGMKESAVSELVQRFREKKRQ